MSEIPDFSLLPAEDPQTTPDDQVAASVVGALTDPTGQTTPLADDPPAPFGSSWVFDWQVGQFARPGGSPAPTSGTGALAEWCKMAIHSARYAHPVFSDEFGMENPDDLIGEFAVGGALSDWQAAIVEALMVHERITSVENFDLDWDSTTGVLTVNNFDVVTDEDETVSVSDVTLSAGGLQ